MRSLVRAIPLRPLVATMVLAPAVVVAGALIVSGTRSGTRIAETLIAEVLDGANARVVARLDAYFRAAQSSSDLALERVIAGDLDPARLDDWVHPNLLQLDAFDETASITFGRPDEACVWVIRTPDGFAGALRPPGDDAEIVEFHADPLRPGWREEVKRYPFTTTGRPWYRTGVDAAEAAWTPIYVWAGTDGEDDEIGTALVRRVDDGAGGLSGVLSVDITLGGLSAYLAGIDLAESDLLLVIDDGERLVASSRGRVVGDDHERLPLASALAIAGAEAPDERGHARLDGAPARVAAARYAPAPGIDWQVLAFVPESVFLADVRRAQLQALAFAIAAAIAALAAALWLARLIVRRAESIQSHVAAVGRGDFTARLEHHGPREWDELAESLNTMAKDLDAYMATRQSLEVAMEVQQSLLPMAAPSIEGLDLSASSHYCDETGGDYFDFIPHAGDRHAQVILALGDVMGHGVAAALLMATARAALRLAAAEPGTLALLLGKVNRILAADARHGRFMTMILATLDPESRTLRWASAGHDPPIILDPATGEVREPDGGNVPLGIVEDVEYLEEVVADLPAGTIVFLGTDGIWEARSADGEMFGKERLLDLLRVNASEPAERIGTLVEHAVREHLAGAGQQDDITFVVAKLR